MYARFYGIAALGLLAIFSSSAQAQTLPLKTVNAGALTHSDPFDTVRQNSHRKVYVGYLSAGKTYVFDLKSTKFDPYLRIETAAGIQVASNDDGGMGLNAQIKFTPMFSGNYRVIVTSFAQDVTGSFLLSYSTFGGGGSGGPSILWLKPGNNPGVLTHSDPFDKIRTQSHRKVYQVSMSAGNTYIFDMTSAQFDTYLRLEDMFGKVVKVDDDSGQGLNARIVFPAKFSGTYRLVATSFAADKTGSFVIKMGVLASPVSGETISGALTFADPADMGRRFDTHVRFLQAGKKYVIRMNSPAFDTLLRLKNPAGTVVAVNDDGGVGLNAQITYVPPVSGMYRIIATSYSPGATGHYTVTVIGQ
jgi:hypothetical protein